MGEFKTAFIVGSLRQDSYNLKLAKALIRLGQGKFQSNIVRIDDLPLYNQDLEKDFPAPVLRMKGEIDGADAVLIVTPEYNRSFPGVLKNAIDWASRPYGKNSFAKKPGALAGASMGAIGTACAQRALWPILGYLDMALMGQPEVYIHFKDNLIDNDGNITVDATKTFLASFVDKFAAHVQRHLTR